MVIWGLYTQICKPAGCPPPRQLVVHVFWSYLKNFGGQPTDLQWTFHVLNASGKWFFYMRRKYWKKKRGQPAGLLGEKGGQPTISPAYIYVYIYIDAQPYKPEPSPFGPFLWSHIRDATICSIQSLANCCRQMFLNPSPFLSRAVSPPPLLFLVGLVCLQAAACSIKDRANL